MPLTASDIRELTEFRHELHSLPELSGEEQKTAASVVRFLASSNPDSVITGLGGHGVAAVFKGEAPGPTVMIRSELDALSIQELSDKPYRSSVVGTGHLCGHDGHTTILAAVARELGRHRPKRGRAVLLFQPAEETGKGAAAVLRDKEFENISPDYAFALHNMPGIPLGTAELSAGPANCASRGLRIVLGGRTAHASMPETGNSPTMAVAELMPALTALGGENTLNEDYRLVTITYATLGKPTFGTTPDQAQIWATLRTLRDEQMTALCEEAEKLIKRVARDGRLSVAMEYDEIFHHCDNDPEAVAILRAAFDEESIPHRGAAPLRGSEDFGLFGSRAKSAMFFLGSGENAPQLHHPDFDFPDELIPVGARIFTCVLRKLLGSA